jgi:hypothetical protein
MPDLIEQTQATEFNIEDLANPRSVISLTSDIPTLQAGIKNLLLTSPELLELEFDEIKLKANPSFTLCRLRMSFWNEYENAITNNRKMKMARIVAGVCTDSLFKAKILPDLVRLAYVLSPPKDYVITVKESLDAGLDNLRAIVTAKVTNDDGSLNAKSADIVLKAIALLDMRVKGAVIQRIDQRSLNVNVNRDVTPHASSAPTSLEALERELDLVKQKLVRDVTQAKLPSSPIETTNMMKELKVALIDTGGSYKLKPPG